MICYVSHFNLNPFIWSCLVNLATYLEMLLCFAPNLDHRNDREKRQNFSPEFRLETAQLVVDNGYTEENAA